MVVSKLNEAEKKTSKETRQQKRKLEAENRKRLQPLQLKIKRIEKELEVNKRVLDDLELKLQQADLYQAEYKEELKDTLSQQYQAKQKNEYLEEAWLHANHELEEFMADLIIAKDS